MAKIRFNLNFIKYLLSSICLSEAYSKNVPDLKNMNRFHNVIIPCNWLFDMSTIITSQQKINYYPNIHFVYKINFPLNGARDERIQILQTTNDSLWGVLPFHPVHVIVIDSSREKLNKNNDFVLLASEGRLSLLSSSGPVSGPNLVQGYSASMKITLLNWLFSRQNS